ncbi:MAG: hypothetical protein IIA23_01245 [Chloroflexi bacterium]|nr:hypothetical protein [Chloroflexota bacterium]
MPNQNSVEKIEYRGWQNCYRLSNGLVDLVVTTDVGPRIIRFGFVGDENEFKEYDEMVGRTGGDDWRIYGGHRLWHAPEARPRTYYADNSPVDLERRDGFVRLIQPTEQTTGIQKEIDILLSSSRARVKLTHRLRVHWVSVGELAPWAISVMAPGGKAILPLPPRAEPAENLVPTSTIALWAYTDMTDRRWTWGNKYVMLAQDPGAGAPQKAGFMATDGWVAYCRGGHLFVKKFDYVDGQRYPDFGSTVELFTNADMLELETLGPLVHSRQGLVVEHVEHWLLFRDVPTPSDGAGVERDVVPRIGGGEA